MVPTNTPVRLPRSDAGSTPARSKASHDTSSSRRCWGSMPTASRGEMPKNPASNRSAPARNPPRSVALLPPPSPASESMSQPRSSGKGTMPSPPAATRSHRSSGEATPPG